MSASSTQETLAPSATVDPTATTATPWPDTTTDLVDPTISPHGSSSSSHWSSSSDSSSFEWHESATPEPTAPPVNESSTPLVPTTPTAATPTAPTPIVSPSTNATTKASSSGGGGKAVHVSLVILGVALVVAVILFVVKRRRRANNRLFATKFHDPAMDTPTISIELPPPSPSLGQSQRLSVFSNARSNGDSMFNTAAVTVSPTLSNSRVLEQQGGRGGMRGGAAGGGGGGAGAPFHPDQSMTYRLVDPSPSHTPLTSLHNETVLTPSHASGSSAFTDVSAYALTASAIDHRRAPGPVASQPRPHRPDYGGGLPYHSDTKSRANSAASTHSAALRKISAATTGTSSTSSFSSLSSEEMTLVSGSAPSTNHTSSSTSVRTSEASTIQGFHDSLCDDLYEYGDGLGRERAASRGRGVFSSTPSTMAPSSTRQIHSKPMMLLEIDELEPTVAIPVSTTSKTPTSSSKTLSIVAMRGGGAGGGAFKRAPPPPPPPLPPSSLPEVAPFDPLLMTSVNVHQLHATEDKSTISSSSSAAVTVSPPPPSPSASSPFTIAHLQSSHNGGICETPLDTNIQRLSDVSSVYSDRSGSGSSSSTLRAGSLIELQQVVEASESVDGVSKEIEI